MPEGVTTALVDGGDRACGELLLVLRERIATLRVGSRLRLVATDPAAVIDLPAWCHLTGHRYLGAGLEPDGRPHYSLEVMPTARATAPTNPWTLEPVSRL
jgi:tRNA 2-thiouridine synthesizing protein A